MHIIHCRPRFERLQSSQPCAADIAFDHADPLASAEQHSSGNLLVLDQNTHASLLTGVLYLEAFSILLPIERLRHAMHNTALEGPFIDQINVPL
jgi:hypothetical protein